MVVAVEVDDIADDDVGNDDVDVDCKAHVDLDECKVQVVDRSSPRFHVVVVVDDSHGLQDVRAVVELLLDVDLLLIQCCRSCRDVDVVESVDALEEVVVERLT